MYRVNQYEFIEMGKAFFRLRSLREGVSLEDAIAPLMTAMTHLRDLLEGKPVSVMHCRHDATELLGKLEAFHRENYLRPGTDEWDGEKNWDDQVPSHHFWGFHSLIDRFEHNLAAELRGSPTYQVADVGIFNTSSLVDTAEDHIPVDLRSMVSEDAKRELNLAGKAIAYGLATAAGFHVLRATELVLEDYYRTFAGPDARPCKSWHDYITQLTEWAESDAPIRPERKTVRNLDQMRDLDRNPVMHPRETYTESKAVEMFNNGTTAIMAMAREMQSNVPELPLLVVENAEAEAGE
ncbi:MAG: hypothetical protein ABJ215_16005 [Alphaproteobacteria bacterium]